MDTRRRKGLKEIKELLISPPVLRAPTPEGLFQLESDTSCKGVRGTLFQKQGDEWVDIRYHSKRLPTSVKNFGVTELELTGLLVNIHGFMQLFHSWYFKVFVDHKAIEYMVKSKTETPTTRLKTLFLKLSEYTINLKYQKGSKMHTSDTLNRLHNLTDTPDNKDVIPLNFLQHLTPNYVEYLYSHWVDNLYVHKTKDYDMTQVKRKHGRPPKQKTGLDITQKPATNTHTVQPKPVHKNSKSEIISRDLIEHINKEWEKSDRSTVARLDSIVKANKQNYKSNLMTEKYSLLPSQSYPLTPVQTAVQ